MPLSEINYAVGQDSMEDVFDKVNAAIVQVNTNTTNVDTNTLAISEGDLPNGIITDNVTLKTKVINIGDWNMDGVVTVTVAHGISDFSKIRNVTAMIRTDSGTGFFPLEVSYSSSVYGITIGSTNVVLSRITSGFFDAGIFSTTSYNRGWITIIYEA